MDKLDSDLQRIAKRRVWSEGEGKRIISAWRRAPALLGLPKRDRAAP